MAKNLAKFEVDDFGGGLNTTDNSLVLRDNELVIADNIKYIVRPDGKSEAQSINGVTQVGDDIVVNSSDATIILGAVTFNGKKYCMASNGTEARLMVFNDPLWQEANAQDFNPVNKVSFAVYNSILWFVNGTTTNSNVLHFLSTSNTLTGLTAAASGLAATMSHIILHLERIWISDGNTLYLSKKYPQAANADWDATSAYIGADVPGVIQIDNNTEDSIQGMVVNFSQLVVLRKYSLWLIAGKILSESEMTKRTNTRTGVIAELSIAKADRTIYIYTDEGVKTFDGQTVKEGTTNIDTISTRTIDYPIENYIANFSNTANIVGYAFRDKYYMSDASSVIFVYDELANNKNGAWSRWIETGADLFLEEGSSLYCFKAEKYYKLDDSTTASLTSKIKTKDYDVKHPSFWKLFHKIIVTFSRLVASSTITLSWHLDGAADASGSETITIQKSSVAWDSGYEWGQSGIRWDQGTINFLNGMKRWLRSGVTIAFTIEATGTNRFSLSRFVLDSELLKKEVT